MAARLRKYRDGLPPDEVISQPRVLHPKLIFGWLLSLKAKDCGAHTLHAGLAMIKWTSVQLIITQE
eukprot:5828430-Amphidinium_carterae.1